MPDEIISSRYSFSIAANEGAIYLTITSVSFLMSPVFFPLLKISPFRLYIDSYSTYDTFSILLYFLCNDINYFIFSYI